MEPGRGDHVVRIEQQRLGPGRIERVHDEPVPAPLDPVDRGVEHVATGGAAHVLVVRGQVPRSQRRASEPSQVGRTRRHERQLAHALPRDRLADLECRVPLADDDDPAVPVAAGRARDVDVVVVELEAGNRRHPRLRHPDREDGRAAAILAVARDEHDRAVLEPRRLPAAAVADGHRSALGEGAHRGDHLVAGRAAVTLRDLARDERRELGLVGEEAVLVVELVPTRSPIRVRRRVRPADQPLEEREALEHAARAVVGGDRRVLDAESPEAVARLQAARTTPDDDHRVLPRREGLRARA